jgi:hypothetical protein
MGGANFDLRELRGRKVTEEAEGEMIAIHRLPTIPPLTSYL